MLIAYVPELVSFPYLYAFVLLELLGKLQVNQTMQMLLGNNLISLVRLNLSLKPPQKSRL